MISLNDSYTSNSVAFILANVILSKVIGSVRLASAKIC